MNRFMKKYMSIKTWLIPMALLLLSCNDWLTETGPGVTELDDFFSSGNTAVQSVNAAYVPLAWDYNSTFINEWFIGDVVSDDALKGGQNINDMADVYDMENFKTNTNNGFLLDFYRAQYQGISRSNLVLQEVPNMQTDTIMDADLKDRLVGEAKFLRALYYFRLVRVFGGVPKIDFVILSGNQWKQPRASMEEIYQFIIDDLLDAEKKLWVKSKYSSEDLGRATKGAAQAMLLKTYLYTHNFVEAEKWGKTLVKQAEENGKNNLCPNYKDNSKLAGENEPESIFKIQNMADQQRNNGEEFELSPGPLTVILPRYRAQK